MIGNPNDDLCPSCHKHALELVNWCASEKEKCDRKCPANIDDIDCTMQEERLVCKSCEAVFEVE